jgi:hypothetical protein
MPLQIRRGPTADRLANTPLAGELVYDTTTGSVFVGNGTAAGGLPVTSFSVGDARTASARLFLGDSLTDNTVHSGVTFAYIGDRLQATVQQNLSNYIGQIGADQGFAGNLWADDSGLIVDSATSTVYGTFVPQGHIIPDTNVAYDLGSSAYRFRDLYLSGSSLYLGSVVLQDIDGRLDLPAGTTIGGAVISLDEGNQYIISIQGNVVAADSTVLVDSTNGKFNGDLYGSVFGFDSSILVDARDGVLRGTLIGALTGNVTGDVVGNASSASIASAVALTATNASSTIQYITFADAATGNENLRTDTDLTYTPSTNTLTASFFVGTLTGTLNGDVTAGTIYTSTIDTSDSSAISVVPAIIFNSDLTVENELITSNVLPSASEESSIGSFTKKYSKLYLTEAANALWIGNAAIGASGSIINLPAGSTIGGSAISAIVGGTNYNIGITANDSSVMVNTSTKVITATTFVGNLTGNVTGTVSSLSNHTIRWFLGAEDSSLVTVNNGDTLKVVGENGIETSIEDQNLKIRINDITSFRPTLNTTDAVNYIPFVGNTSSSSYIGSSVNLRYNPGTGYFDVPIVNSATVFAGIAVATPIVSNSTSALFLTSTFNDGTILSNTVQVGNSTTDGRFSVQIGSYITGTNPWINYRQIHDTADANNMLFSRARGTVTAPTVVQTGDDIIDMSFGGYDGTIYRSAALINVATEGTVTGTAVPGRVTIQTASSTGSLVNAVVINSKQETAFNGPAVLRSYANTTARDTAITAPSAGMLVYITATGKFQGYNGVTSGWDDLN